MFDASSPRRAAAACGVASGGGDDRDDSTMTRVSFAAVQQQLPSSGCGSVLRVITARCRRCLSALLLTPVVPYSGTGRAAFPGSALGSTGSGLAQCAGSRPGRRGQGGGRGRLASASDKRQTSRLLAAEERVVGAVPPPAARAPWRPPRGTCGSRGGARRGARGCPSARSCRSA